MKKNDTISLVVYALMLAIALVVGIVMIRPLTESIDTDALGGISFPVVIVLAIVVGILLSAGLIEVGHLIGAKIGHYEILSFVILGLGAKKGKDGKFHFYAGGFDGLTGEVAVSPKDREKSSLRAYIYLPLLFLVLLIIAMAVCMVFSGPQEAPTTPWLYAASLLVLTVSGIILLYDIFPAELDSTNDGYRLVLISNPKNKMAYNDTLLARKCERMGEAIPALEPYRDLTDFTASINNILMYQASRAETQYNRPSALFYSVHYCLDFVRIWHYIIIFEEVHTPLGHLTDQAVVILLRPGFRHVYAIVLRTPVAYIYSVGNVSCPVPGTFYGQVFLNGLLRYATHQMQPEFQAEFMASVYYGPEAVRDIGP